MRIYEGYRLVLGFLLIIYVIYDNNIEYVLGWWIEKLDFA